ncbi:SH3 domain-containing protein [Streptomyces sp. NPDC093094]|uniref:SH3 domain-containing protein n=1 Tax=Streptomyces sp. NPDC093094 TaxID=3366026 RepID=UPI0037F8552C
MSLCSRLVISLTAAALAAGAAAAPALASEPGHRGSQNPRLYKGVVTANTLLLRAAPTRGSQVIRTVRRGQIVKIYCKTTGENVQGNRLWYLLPDGTWAWGSARYIDNIGPAPRWC